MITLLLIVSSNMKLFNEISRFKIIPPYLPRGDYIIVLEKIATGNKKVLASQTLYKFLNLVPPTYILLITDYLALFLLLLLNCTKL